MSHELSANAPFNYASTTSLVHLINHNLNTLVPDTTVIDQATNEEIVVTTLVVDANNVQITLAVPLAIRGKVQ